MKRANMFRLGCALLIGAAWLSGNASASSYQAWYDDAGNGFEPGDLLADNARLSVPEGACALRFELPAYYRWVGEYSNTLFSADLDSAVEIWVPRPGCPYKDRLVFKTRSGRIFDPPRGTRYLELHSYYGSDWIGADGKRLPCLSDCARLAGLDYPH